MAFNWKVYGSELDDPITLQHYQSNSSYDLKQQFNYEEERKKIKYPEFLSTFSSEEAGQFKRSENPNGSRDDKGHLGDKSFKNLFTEGKKYETFDLSPNFGTEVDGIQLSELDDAGKNDLALFLETRGLVVFRNQDFRDKGPKFVTQFGKYFGPLHIHPVSDSAENYPEVFSTYRPLGDASRYEREFELATSRIAWHSDISFEEYPASFSFFVALEAPDSGGDTVFIDSREAYRRLSPILQRFFESLTVIHSNYYQNKLAKLKNRVLKVDGDLFTEHPLVRTHPVTGEKSLYFSRNFIHRVKGVKPTESAAILNFLEDHVLNNPEIQVRALHKGTDSRTVIAWDNRILLHTATLDFLQHKTGPRHHFRLTVLGEKPYLDLA